MGTHARHTLTFMEMVSPQLLVPGDHFRRLHDRMVCTLVELVRSARVLVKGGHTGTCKDIFSKCHKVGDVARLLYGTLTRALLEFFKASFFPFCV